MSNNDTLYSLVPELGDLVTFVSTVLKSTTGRIIYRDDTLIRIRPSSSSTTAVDFPLDPVTGLFIDTLGVTDVLVHTKRKDPHFSKQLSVVKGELLEFYDSDGKALRDAGVVFEVIADKDDAIKLEDGTILNFQFLGPPAPYSVLRPRAPPEVVLPPENDSETEVQEVAVAENFPEIDFTQLPLALVEEIPSEERTYSDSVQREDMFVSMLMEETPKKQKDPKVMQYLYRLTDVLLALKNSVVVRDEAGAVLPSQIRSYTAETLEESLIRQPTGSPLAAVMPVAAVKKVLYGDTDDVQNLQDAEFRPDIVSLIDTQNAATQFLNGSYTGNEFIAYMNSVLTTIGAYTSGVGSGDGAVITVDQDVLRSQMPPQGVEGFPTVPGRDKYKKIIPLTADYLGTIQDRVVRLLSASRITNTKTRTTYTVAPADSGETVGHMVLSSDVAAYRSPIRSSVLLWDIQASLRSRDRQTTFYKTFTRRFGSQKVLGRDITLAGELGARLPPVTSFIQPESVAVFDGLGLRTLELTDRLLGVVVKKMEAAQTSWDAAHAKLAAAAGVAAVSARAPVVAAVVGNDSPLLSVLESAPQMAARYAELKAKEPFLGGYDLTVASEFLAAGNTTFAAVWYAVAGAVDADMLAAAETRYTSESGRLARNDQVARGLAAAFTASPTINPCEHVSKYEKIRGIRADEARMVLFERFMRQYQAGQDGNYILCGACGKDLVCKHEVLLLNEYLNPGRGAALHKALLLEYAGPVFEGSYICKTCGQKILDIEYDTHMEFDDEGRPLVGRTIITDEDEDDDFSLAIRAQADADIPFTGADRTLYFNQRTLFELCGMAFGLETYTRTVAAAKLYLEKYVKNEADYTGLQKKLAAARRPIGYDFKTYFGNQIVGVIGALAVLELQTSTINIPIAAAGCALSRDGFPLDGLVPESAGVGALHYVACALAQIKRDDAPWNTVSWSPESNMEKRIKEAEKTIMLLLNTLLAVPLTATQVRPVVEGVTEPYRAALETAKERKTALASGTTMIALASSADKLPPSFRPLPRIVVESMIDEEPIGNVKRFEANVAAGNVKTVGPIVKKRMRQLNQTIMGYFHAEADKTGVPNHNNACSESVCCFKRLADVAANGLGVGSLNLAEAVKNETDVLAAAATAVWKADPAFNGTHIYVPWSSPTVSNILPEADASIYYKLFLKSCFRGRTFGLPHELDLGFTCRNCGFAYPEELVFLTAADIGETDGKKRGAAMSAMDTRRTKVALDAFQAQGIEITDETFKHLEAEIRNRKTVAPIVIADAVGFLDRLQSMTGTLGFLLPNAAEDWMSLTEAMNVIVKDRLVEVRRLGKLTDFSRRFDERLKQMRAGLIDVAAGRTEKVVGAALDALVAITTDATGGHNVRNLQSVFVVGGMQVAREYYVEKPTNMKVWFPSINRNHQILLQNIWKTMTEVSRTTVQELDEFDDDTDTKDLIRKVLERFTGWFGPWLHIWRTEFRPDVGFTAKEFTSVLQWSVASGILSLATYDGPMYSDGTSYDSRKKASSFICDWIVRALADAGAKVTRYQLTDEQIKERVAARIEKEKQMFIQKMDKKEPEMRKLELTKKKLKIGDWSVGTTKKLFSYDPEMFEFERSQRAEMGVPDFADDITGVQEEAETAAEAAGFFQFGVEEVGMSEGTLHRAAQDEDDSEPIEGAGRIHISC